MRLRACKASERRSRDARPVRALRSSPGAGYKQQFPRHGAKWDEEEKQRLIALAEAGMLDVDEFAREYQRRPESILKYMKKTGLLDKRFSDI